MSAADWGILLLAALVSYWIGAVSPASIAARLKGADLRGTGSGNPGATNAARTMGRATGVTVGLLDILKGLLPALFFSQFDDPAGQIAGLAAVLGHITSPFLGGKGGKGVATTLGAVLALNPLWVIPMLIAFGVTLRLTRRMGIGSVAATLTLVPVSLVFWSGWADLAFAAALTVMILLRHQGNIAAFMSGRGAHPAAPGAEESAEPGTEGQASNEAV